MNKGRPRRDKPIYKQEWESLTTQQRYYLKANRKDLLDYIDIDEPKEDTNETKYELILNKISRLEELINGLYNLNDKQNNISISESIQTENKITVDTQRFDKSTQTDIETINKDATQQPNIEVVVNNSNKKKSKNKKNKK